MTVVAMTCGEFHGYLENGLVARGEEGSVNLQNTSPVEPKDENGKTSAVQDQANPIKMDKEISGQLLSVKHTESWWICR